MIFINGIEANKINATDRGLTYGDGLFSTIKIEFGLVVDWGLHLSRLQSGCQRLFFPDVDWTVLENEVFSIALLMSEQSHAVLKVILTRGCGGRGYSALGCDSPMRIISLSEFPEMYLQWQAKGIAIMQCETTLGRNKQLAGLKSLARLEQVIIKQELVSQQAIEGLVCDELGHVIEACSANLFILLNGQWRTPKLDYCGVAGVMRARILAQTSLSVIEQNISLDDVQQATVMCLSNALMGIVPINKYQEKSYSNAQLAHVHELQNILNQGSLKHD